MKGISIVKHSFFGAGLTLTGLLLGACAATPVSTVSGEVMLQQAGYGATGYGHGSEVEGQLDDGGWIINTPGQAHVHKVLLEECPEQPVITRHVHNHLQAQQIGSGPHKHRGCFICPPKNSLVKRILSH